MGSRESAQHQIQHIWHDVFYVLSQAPKHGHRADLWANKQVLTGILVHKTIDASLNLTGCTCPSTKPIESSCSLQVH